METIPEKYMDLLADEKKAFIHLGTIMADGTPQVTPVWFNHDEEYILINSAKGRVKDQNMRARSNVACLIVDPDNHYRYMQIRGKVEEITEEGADVHINDLREKYHGERGYPIGDDIRVTYKIKPESVSAMG